MFDIATNSPSYLIAIIWNDIAFAMTVNEKIKSKMVKYNFCQGENWKYILFKNINSTSFFWIKYKFLHCKMLLQCVYNNNMPYLYKSVLKNAVVIVKFTSLVFTTEICSDI